jgi:hypothetical protein
MTSLERLILKISKSDVKDFIPKLKKLYPEYEIFQPVDDLDYLIFRRVLEKSIFYKDTGKEKFTVDLYKDIKLHRSELHHVLKKESAVHLLIKNIFQKILKH